LRTIDPTHPPPPRARVLLTGLLLAAAALAPAANAAPGGSCADCCQLPCIEARIWQATFMKRFYQRLASTKGLTRERYEQREADAHQLSSVTSQIYLNANPSCNWSNPEPSSPEARELLNNTGFAMRVDGKYVTWNFTVEADPMACKFQKPRALDLFPKITSCDGIGRSVIAHEQKHVEDCCKRAGGKLEPAGEQPVRNCQMPATPRGGQLTPQQNAADEVAGYESELNELKKARLESATACNKGSCKTSQMKFDSASRLFHTDILALLGKGQKKSPSKSPLARGRKGS
jgi:hypothetical protein